MSKGNSIFNTLLYMLSAKALNSSVTSERPGSPRILAITLTSSTKSPPISVSLSTVKVTLIGITSPAKTATVGVGSKTSNSIPLTSTSSICANALTLGTAKLARNTSANIATRKPKILLVSIVYMVLKFSYLSNPQPIYKLYGDNILSNLNSNKFTLHKV